MIYKPNHTEMARIKTLAIEPYLNVYYERIGNVCKFYRILPDMSVEFWQDLSEIDEDED
jgi:hypothetical protein